MPSAVNHVQTNLASGELDPTMLGRRDTSMYTNGAKTLTNNAPFVTGGVRRRPGTQYIATLPATVRLGKLQFNETQLYIFAFSNARLDIYNASTNALIQTLTGQPWDATTMWQMKWTQTGDTTILVHEDFAMRKIVRTSATTFTSDVYAFEAVTAGFPIYQPYFKFADNAITMTPSATSGSVTLTLSADHWVAGHVGSRVRYKGKTCTITAFTSATVVTATVNETLSATTADTEWDENVFSAINGYARSVSFHGRRLWFGGTKSLPRNAFSSKKGAYFNFDVGTGLDDESIQAEVAVAQIGEIVHSHSGRHLQFLCDTGVVYVPETDANPVSPKTFNPRFSIPYGARQITPPRHLDGADLYIQDTGKVVRELIHNDFQQAYTGEAVSLVSSNLINDVQDLDVLYGHTDGPEQFALVVNGDGTISCFHTIRGEKISGWFPWETSGLFESVVTLNNEAWVTCRRTINSSTVYFLEKFDFDLTLDCAIKFNAASATAFTVAHLPNTMVYGVANNRAVSHGGVTTNNSGVATFPDAATQIDVGLDYTRSIETLPPVIQTTKGDMSGELMRLGVVVLEVSTSVNFSVNGHDFLVRQVGDDFSLAPTKQDGKHRFEGLLGWSRAPTITITQDVPLEFNLLSIWTEVWT
tara:strand:+ start:779 stop:2704 length:1926 start_codon:yes stop_codon:yes gene_type:complete